MKSQQRKSYQDSDYKWTTASRRFGTAPSTEAPFREVNEDEFFVEDDWYELKGPDSLRYHYSEKDVQRILRERAEKRAAKAEKEIIDLTGDSD